MAVTAQQVKALREKTQAGMMDCKRALEEANGDFEKAKSSYQKSFQYQPFNFETLEALSNLDNEILDLNLKKQIKKIIWLGK